MYNKLDNLGFIIGVFFLIVSLILIIGGLLSAELSRPLNFYTGFGFFVFGLLMVLFNRSDTH